MQIGKEDKEFIKETFNIDLDIYDEEQQEIVIDEIIKFLDKKILEEEKIHLELLNKINEILENKQE